MANDLVEFQHMNGTALGRENLPAGRLMVRAILPGHYGDKYRNSGDQFEIENAARDYSGIWMKPINGLGVEPGHAATPEDAAEGTPAHIMCAGEKIVL